jgi:hypothetical protein
MEGGSKEGRKEGRNFSTQNFNTHHPQQNTTIITDTQNQKIHQNIIYE